MILPFRLGTPSQVFLLDELQQSPEHCGALALGLASLVQFHSQS